LADQHTSHNKTEPARNQAAPPAQLSGNGFTIASTALPAGDSCFVSALCVTRASSNVRFCMRIDCNQGDNENLLVSITFACKRCRVREVRDLTRHRRVSPELRALLFGGFRYFAAGGAEISVLISDSRSGWGLLGGLRLRTSRSRLRLILNRLRF